MENGMQLASCSLPQPWSSFELFVYFLPQAWWRRNARRFLLQLREPLRDVPRLVLLRWLLGFWDGVTTTTTTIITTTTITMTTTITGFIAWRFANRNFVLTMEPVSSRICHLWPLSANVGPINLAKKYSLVAVSCAGNQLMAKKMQASLSNAEPNKEVKHLSTAICCSSQPIEIREIHYFNNYPEYL